MFDIGDRIVCVAPMPGDFTSPWQPSVGSIYTCVEYGENKEGEGWVDVKEDPEPRDDDSAWSAKCFRRLGRADLLTKLLADPQFQDERDGKRVVTPRENA